MLYLIHLHYIYTSLIIKKGPYGNTQSEIDEADDKFDIEDGDNSDNNMYVDLPEEKTSLLTDEEEEAHNAPTL